MAGVRVNCVCPAVTDTPLVRNGLKANEGNMAVIEFTMSLIEKQGGFLK